MLTQPKHHTNITVYMCLWGTRSNWSWACIYLVLAHRSITVAGPNRLKAKTAHIDVYRFSLSFVFVYTYVKASNKYCILDTEYNNVDKKKNIDMIRTSVVTSPIPTTLIKSRSSYNENGWINTKMYNFFNKTDWDSAGESVTVVRIFQSIQKGYWREKMFLPRRVSPPLFSMILSQKVYKWISLFCNSIERDCFILIANSCNNRYRD